MTRSKEYIKKGVIASSLKLRPKGKALKQSKNQMTNDFKDFFSQAVAIQLGSNYALSLNHKYLAPLHFKPINYPRPPLPSVLCLHPKKFYFHIWIGS